MGFLSSLFSKMSAENIKPNISVDNAYHSSLNWLDTKSWIRQEECLTFVTIFRSIQK
ncbi:hypothetical protein Fluta_2252 [Fluviicola taffensis DSM 16823]|uniref:Uncharacterized protein n=1 Tax=Fluviicola taffensis (strain DSM 16823 / NCIMB 13979 / RW262) TaxID=755732 RepID=F2IAT3_FLUTR|nr:hypothetical protein Fluta_2252 [Fluviicola taffensis DSM 16823]